MSGKRSGLEDLTARDYDQVSALELNRSKEGESDGQIHCTAPSPSAAAESVPGINQSSDRSKPSTWSQMLAGCLKPEGSIVSLCPSFVKLISSAGTDHLSCYTALASQLEARNSISAAAAGASNTAESAAVTEQEKYTILQAARKMKKQLKQLRSRKLKEGEMGEDREAKSACVAQLQEVVIDGILELMFSKCQGLATPEVAAKLKFLHGVKPLLHDAYRLVGISLLKKPLIVDLPWVSYSLAEDKTLLRVDISDGSLALMLKYIKGSTTAADLPGARLLKLFKQFGADVLSQTAQVKLLNDQQVASVNAELYKEVLMDAIDISARNVVQKMMSQSVAAFIVGDLSDRVDELKFLPVADPIQVAWTIKKQDGSEFEGSKSPRYALWLKDSSEFMFTIPREHSSQREFERHVQQIAWELARFVMANIPWSALEARLLAHELRGAVRLDLFPREYANGHIYSDKATLGMLGP